MDVIPTGFAFVDGDTELTDALLQKHGTRLYIDGDLNLKDGSENCLERLDALCVKGNVRLLKRQEEAFSRVDATYEALVFVKGRYIANQPKIVVDQALLEASPDGMEIRNCAVLKVKKDAAAELILERLWVGNCAHVFCSPEQKSSIQLVCGNVAKISEGEQEEEEDEGGMLGKLKKMMGSRVVNADTYIL